MTKATNLTELYQESQRELDKVQYERNMWMDKVREEARRKTSMIRATYMIDEMEAAFRGIARRLIILSEHGVITDEDLKEFAFTPEGLEVRYENPTGFLDAGGNLMLDSTGEFVERFVTVLFTWDEIQEELDKEGKNGR